MTSTWTDGRDPTAILAYADPWSAAPGEAVRICASCREAGPYRLRFVRVVLADPDPAGPGLDLRDLASQADGIYQGRNRPIPAGSFAICERPVVRTPTAFSIACLVFPTGPGAGRDQVVIAQMPAGPGAGFLLGLDPAGAPTMLVRTAGGEFVSATTGVPLPARRWVMLTATFDTAAGLGLAQRPVEVDGGPDISADAGWRGHFDTGSGFLAPLTFAASGPTNGNDLDAAGRHYDGRIERPLVLAGVRPHEELRAALLAGGTPEGALAAWDFSDGIGTDRIVDTGPHAHHGRTVNCPARGVTGHDWASGTNEWWNRPDQYGAVHFHHDDLADCRWPADGTLTIPADWKSGYYAAILETETAKTFVPFFVRPPRERRTARVAYIAGTATYLAYANTHVKFDSLNSENLFESLLVVSESELFLNEHRELGYSTYDIHSDRSGVFYSSRLRPILTMRPDTYTFNYVNDTYVCAWLEAVGEAYDVVTDEDLDAEGDALLAGYDVVITGSHPEYYTTAMWDALDAYQRAGGRHMYLGGNGFYWRMASSPRFPGMIEIRRGVTGVRTWEGEPGEDSLSFSAEPGGLWRTAGRAPQKLVGVGFSATLFNRSTHYVRNPDSFDPRVAFMFDGIEPDERIGDFGMRGGGAAGLEIDRHDAGLGAPAHALVVASSREPGYGGLLSVEEFITTTRGLDGDQNANVRADVVFFETPNGGAVWSTGSIAWATSLLHDGCDNNVSRMTRNVLGRFLDPTPFPPPGRGQSGRP